VKIKFGDKIMTANEDIVLQTLYDNKDVLYDKGMVVVELKGVKDKKGFKDALSTLEYKKYIHYSSSLTSVIIRITAKGELKIESGKYSSTI
jgi:hypothetical protein